MQGVVIIPTYNERQNLAALVEAIRKNAPDLHIVIVDDNSPDGTGDLAEELRARMPESLTVIHRPKKEGLGPAYVAGFRYALQKEYDVIMQMDGDLSHDPSYLPALLARIEDCDLALGSRYLHGINVVNWDFKRLLLSKMAAVYVRRITGMPLSDATGGYKCWRRVALAGIDLAGVFSNGYLFQVEMSYKAYRRGFCIREVPIIFYERRSGSSKMHWRIIWEALWGVLRLRLQGGWPARKAARAAGCVAESPGRTAA